MLEDSPSLGPSASLPQDPCSKKRSLIPSRSPWARPGGEQGNVALELHSAGIWGSGISEKGRDVNKLFLPTGRLLWPRPQNQTQEKNRFPTSCPPTPPHTLQAPGFVALRASRGQEPQ